MRTILLTSLGGLALLLAAAVAAQDASATTLAAAANRPAAAEGATFGYRCAPRVRRVVVRRRYVRPVCAPAYSPRYVVRRSYYTPYAYRPYYYPSVGIGLGFGYRHGYAGRSHYGHRHGGRTIGRRR